MVRSTCSRCTGLHSAASPSAPASSPAGSRPGQPRQKALSEIATGFTPSEPYLHRFRLFRREAVSVDGLGVGVGVREEGTAAAVTVAGTHRLAPAEAPIQRPTLPPRHLHSRRRTRSRQRRWDGALATPALPRAEDAGRARVPRLTAPRRRRPRSSARSRQARPDSWTHLQFFRLSTAQGHSSRASQAGKGRGRGENDKEERGTGGKTNKVTRVMRLEVRRLFHRM